MLSVVQSFQKQAFNHNALLSPVKAHALLHKTKKIWRSYSQASTKHPVQATVCWISETTPALSRYFSGGLQKAEQNVKRVLSTFYISKIVWVPKQGGCYVHFGNIKDCQQAVKHWNKSSQRGKAYMVEGDPFIEDLSQKHASPILEIKMRPKPLSQEELFNQLRKFGQMKDLIIDEAKSTARVTFENKSDANAARNCLDGKMVGETELDIAYIPTSWKIPIDVITSPRAIVPLAGIAVAALTLLLNPIRLYFVAQRLTVEQSVDFRGRNPNHSYVWVTETSKEKELREWLDGAPSNPLLIIGPKGTDKTTLIMKLLQWRLFAARVNCGDVSSTQDFIDHFVRDIGFRPSFAALNQIIFVLFSSFLPNATQSSADVQMHSVLRTLDRVFLIPRASGEKGVIVFDEFDKFLKLLDSDNKDESKRAALVLQILGNWAQTTTRKGHAHVIFVSNSSFARDALQRLDVFKSIPTMWLNDISMKEAEDYLQSQIMEFRGGNHDPRLESSIPHILKLVGGRLGDLDHILFQMGRGQSVEQALSIMLEEAKMTVRRRGLGGQWFGGTKLDWSQAAFWKIMKLLKHQDYIKLDTVLVTVFEGNEVALRSLVENKLLNVTTSADGEAVLTAHSPLLLAAFRDILEKDTELYWGMEKYCKQVEIDKEAASVDKIETELVKLSRVMNQDQISVRSGGIEQRCKQLDAELSTVGIKLAKKKEELSDILKQVELLKTTVSYVPSF